MEVQLGNDLQTRLQTQPEAGRATGVPERALKVQLVIKVRRKTGSETQGQVNISKSQVGNRMEEDPRSRAGQNKGVRGPCYNKAEEL